VRQKEKVFTRPCASIAGTQGKKACIGIELADLAYGRMILFALTDQRPRRNSARDVEVAP